MMIGIKSRFTGRSLTLLKLSSLFIFEPLTTWGTLSHVPNNHFSLLARFEALKAHKVLYLRATNLLSPSNMPKLARVKRRSDYITYIKPNIILELKN